MKKVETDFRKMTYSVLDFEKIAKHTLSDMILQVNSYFWGSLSVYFGVKVADREDMPACAYTDYKNIFFNVNYINKKELDLDKDQWTFIIMHELLHIILGHNFRREDKIPDLWNIACDYVINSMIVNENIGKKPEFALYDKQFEGKSVEEVYKWLKTKYKKLLDDTEALLKQLAADGRLNGIQLDSHDAEGELTDLGEAMVKSIVNNHVQNFSHNGSELAKRIIDSLKPEPIDFRLYLRNYLKPYMKNEYTWSRPLKKGLTHGYYMPNYKVNRRLVVNLGIDTSGSIDEQTLKKFLGAFLSLVAQFPKFLIRVWFFSTNVHTEKILELTEKDNRYKFIDDILTNGVPSFGGTDIESNIRYIKENKLDGDVFICMTDGIDSIHNMKYDGNLLWAIVNNDEFKNPDGCKYGKVMHIKGGK